jgi:hypothetical protein
MQPRSFVKAPEVATVVDHRLLQCATISPVHFIPHDRTIGFTALVEKAIVTLLSPQQRCGSHDTTPSRSLMTIISLACEGSEQRT